MYLFYFTMVLLNLFHRLFWNKFIFSNFHPFLFNKVIVLQKPISKNYSCDHNENKLDCNAECEQKINNQISMELHASYAYLAIAYYFNRSSVALPGFQNLFLHCSEEEIEHARFFMDYQNLRGGKIILCDIKVQDNVDWTPQKAVQTAINLEINVTKSILDLHSVANKHNDVSLSGCLDSLFIDAQYRTVRQLNELYTKMKRCGDNEGLHILDQELLRNYKPALKQK